MGSTYLHAYYMAKCPIKKSPSYPDAITISVIIEAEGPADCCHSVCEHQLASPLVDLVTVLPCGCWLRCTEAPRSCSPFGVKPGAHISAPWSQLWAVTQKAKFHRIKT